MGLQRVFVVLVACFLAQTRAFTPPLRPSCTTNRHRVASATSSFLPPPHTSQLHALPFDNHDISTAFSIATFAPQPLWMLMILAPNRSFTKIIMESWGPIIALGLVHLFIVVVSISLPSGTAPIAEFADVFDPAKDNLGAMLGMMRYPNFVSEEWSHVLLWDLLIGRFIWQDGIQRGVFTPHSVLLTNLIGPPGLLLHFLTCTVCGKGLPPPAEAEETEG